jgi:hypothetical protein
MIEIEVTLCQENDERKITVRYGTRIKDVIPLGTRAFNRDGKILPGDVVLRGDITLKVK